MKTKNIIIIGAGIAGLSAGCYLQMNGYNTEIFEAHNLPGGLCTAWKRKGYTIEGCIHGLLGSSPSHPFYKLWNEIIDMEKIKFVDQEIKEIYDFGNDKKFIKYANLKKLERYMKEIAYEDKAIIEEFIRDIRRFQTIEMPVDKPKEFFNVIDILKMFKAIPLIFVIKKWGKISAEDFARKFKNPFLREIVKHFSSPVLFEMFVLSEMDLKRCGYPEIGSLEFSKLFEKKYLSCDGKINYSKKVSKILVENDKAIGIQLENGEIYKADIVISAIDGRTTIFDMLEGKYINKTISNNYENAELNPSRIQVALGINKTLVNFPRTVKLILSQPLVLNSGDQYNTMDVLIYNDTKKLLPQNKTLIVIQLETKNDEYWTALKKKDKEGYKEEKERISKQIIEILDKRLVEIKNDVEMIDVTTPATYIRYTNNWRGSIQGWANENIFKTNPFKKKLPNLSGFYMVGQWVEPGGGIPTVFKSGRDLAQIICKKDRKIFKTKKEGK